MTAPAAALDLRIKFADWSSSPAQYAYDLTVAYTLTPDADGVFTVTGDRADLKTLACRAIHAHDFSSMADPELILAAIPQRRAEDLDMDLYEPNYLDPTYSRPDHLGALA